VLYPKNLPHWERWLRVVVGIALVAYGLLGTSSLIMTSIALISAAVVLITGFIGYCPACAVAGRKALNKDIANH